MGDEDDTGIGDPVKKQLRAALSYSLSKAFDLGGPNAPQKYVDFVSRLPAPSPTSRRVRQVLLNLPITGIFTVCINNDGDSFRYCTDPSDDFHLSCRMQFLEYEPGTRAAFARLARISRTVVDVGAYAGLYSLIAAAANTECSVVAFEPSPTAFRLLERNIEVNSLDLRIRAVPFGLADCSGHTFLFGTSDRSASTTASLLQPLDTAQSEASTSISVARLDEISAVQAVDLMKIDVEGAEVAVLLGASRTLSTHRPTLLIEALTDTDLAAQHSVLQAFGYTQPMSVKPQHSSVLRNYFWIHNSRRDESLEVVHEALEISSN